MLTLLLSLALRLSTPATCAPPAELPELSMPAPDWAFVPPRTSTCRPSSGAAALMYDVGIDAAVPVEASEVEADIYQFEE